MAITVTIPAKGPKYLPGARLLALLAYPPRSASDSRWRRAERALFRATLLGIQGLDPDWARQPQTVIPDHLAFPEADVKEALDDMRAAHHHRIIAANAAWPSLNEAYHVARGRAPTKHRRSTRNQIIQKLIEEEAERDEWLDSRDIQDDRRIPADPHNFATRVFRPSLPVIHVAVATGQWVERTRKAAQSPGADERSLIFEHVDGAQAHLLELLGLPTIVADIVARAEALEPLVPALTRGPSPKLVRLRMEAADHAHPDATAA